MAWFPAPPAPGPGMTPMARLWISRMCPMMEVCSLAAVRPCDMVMVEEVCLGSTSCWMRDVLPTPGAPARRTGWWLDTSRSRRKL